MLQASMLLRVEVCCTLPQARTLFGMLFFVVMVYW